jgi:hypothetical protein
MCLFDYFRRQYGDPAWVQEFRTSLQSINSRLDTIMATIADLQASVAKETDAENAVVLLLQGISKQLKDAQASGDPAALAAVITNIDANTAKLSQAVVDNTPAA